MKLRFFTLFVFCFIPLFAVETIEGPAHEAFLSPVRGIKAQQVVSKKPPLPIEEVPPNQTDPRTTWIPGYWGWDHTRQDFIWIGGVWRRVPPGQEWIAGLWQQTEQNWAWYNGFWSNKGQASQEYIDATPPEPIEEQVTSAPSEVYFWASGYWQFDRTTRQFTWLGGRWEHFDSNWILVPAHYETRPQGYVFTEAYWDWTLKERGIAYASLAIPEEARKGYVYRPTVVVEPSLFIRYQFFKYPDYLYFYLHSNYYNPDFWVTFQFAPPWWEWNTWWTITWKNQWLLWWWWTHPGFASPVWMTQRLADAIAPPAADLVALMEKVSASTVVQLKSGTMGDANVRPKGKATRSVASLAKPQIPTAAVSTKLTSLIKVPVKPTAPSDTSIYRPRPASDTENITPAIRQPVFPSQRPNLDWSKPTIPRDTFKSVPATPASSETQQSRYAPQQAEKATTPFSETKRVYRPSQPQYTAPTSNYQPQSFAPSRIPSSFSDEIYSPPDSGSYQPRESVRTPSSDYGPVNYFTPSVDLEQSHPEQTESKGEHR